MFKLYECASEKSKNNSRKHSRQVIKCFINQMGKFLIDLETWSTAFN